MSQQCNFMGMVSLQQGKPQHMMHFPLLPTILSTLWTTYLTKPLSDELNREPWVMHTMTQWNAKPMSISCATQMKGEAKVFKNILIEEGGERLPNAPRLHWVSLALNVSAGSRQGWISENCPTLLEELQVCTFLHYKHAKCNWFNKNNIHQQGIKCICKSDLYKL